MAIRKPISYKSIDLPEAYFRVVCPQVDAGRKTMSFGVWAFASGEAAKSDANMLAGAAVTITDAPFDIGADNLFAQAYRYLKTLEDFQDAEDA